MQSEEMRHRTQQVWDRFYNFSNVWKRSACVKSLKSRLAFVLISKLYRQMYASTGLATDSARRTQANKWAKVLAKACRKLFIGKPMPELRIPETTIPALPVLTAPVSDDLLRVIG
jgi:hypothetical protein